jgi:hypothetical protein
MTCTPSKLAYDKALETVKAYEDRQKQLEYLENELSYKLQEFLQPKFKINKKLGEVIFAGFHVDKDTVVVGKSVCQTGDIFEHVIGKLIAVKNALHEDVSDIVNLVESKQPTEWKSIYLNNTGGLIKTDTINTGSIAKW